MNYVQLYNATMIAWLFQDNLPSVQTWTVKTRLFMNFVNTISNQKYH
jgi:uncharacterized membrane protein